MKHPIGSFLVVLCMATSLFAQNSSDSQAKQITGTICNSACVERVSNLSTCNTSCTDTSGSAVIVDDQGGVKAIENQDMAMPHMKKRVKCTAVPTEKDREDYLRIIELSEMGG